MIIFFLNNRLNRWILKGLSLYLPLDDYGLRQITVTAIFIPFCDYDANIYHLMIPQISLCDI